MEKDLIESAIKVYDDFMIGEVLKGLSESIDRDRVKDIFNTLSTGREEKAGSFEVFKNIRAANKSLAYFHIPFCKNNCPFCTYEKLRSFSKEIKLSYLDCLKSEIEKKKGILGDNLNPDIFYIGGGTPSLLGVEEWRDFLDFLSEVFNIKDSTEFTVETDVKEVILPQAKEKFSLLKEKGVNRINLGVQSFSEEVLKKTGRNVNLKDTYQAFKILREIDFEKVNIDLIYGLPGQDLRAWQEDLEHTVNLSPDSITTFYLRIRPSTPIEKMRENSPHLFASEKEKIVMRIMALRYIQDNGYFEDNSDYFIKSEKKRYMYHPAQPHNIHRNLIGFGSSAYSLAGNLEIFNVKDTQKYMRMIGEGKDPVDKVIVLSGEEYKKKRFADGLRTSFDDNLFKEEFSKSIFEEIPEIINYLLRMELIIAEKNTMRFTEKGRITADCIGDFVKYCRLTIKVQP